MSTSRRKGGILRTIAIDNTIMAVLAIIMGIVLVAVPASSGAVICMISGVLLICAGIVAMAGVFIYGPFLSGYSMVMGIALVMCGLLCITQAPLVMGLLTIIFGIFIVVDAATSLVDGIYCTRSHVKGGMLLIVLSVILLVLGVLVVFGPVETVVVFLGWVLIIDGVFDIVAMIAFGKRIRKAKRAFYTDDIIDLGEQ